jgi:hypothetical protein
LSDPVSWFVIEAGWAVVSSDGTEVGAVERVLGDESHDIFDGLVLTGGVFGRARSVRAERVAGIVQGRVTLDLSPDEVKDLPEYRAGAGSIPPAS